MWQVKSNHRPIQFQSPFLFQLADTVKILRIRLESCDSVCLTTYLYLRTYFIFKSKYMYKINRAILLSLSHSQSHSLAVILTVLFVAYIILLYYLCIPITLSVASDRVP